MSTSSCPWSDPALQTTRCRAVIDELKLNMEEKHQEMIEILESALAKRKAKRRATAKQVGEAPQ